MGHIGLPLRRCSAENFIGRNIFTEMSFPGNFPLSFHTTCRYTTRFI
jgi:hypothetical protein